ncbi:acylphosphatase [Olsenella profusa]|uniref:acylphosphatase n=1 Tax=Olsenella profusa TaxID=138595 RepID=A0ABS2F0Z7_9ACTN|nr:acylphosphatase [Olsenella profusa]MBM6774263.1 acylphosphatase [Olsenella profusa]
MFKRWREEHADDGASTPPEDAKRLKLRFVGQVQGVGFRWTSSMVAKRLGLTGWVRNNPDGSVSAEIQGEPSHVGAYFSQMLEEYRHHPISYVIAEREDIPVDPGERRFEVRY